VTAGSPPSVETVRLVLVPEQSEARYRVREQLANQSLPNDAVGTTRDINGVVVLTTDGRIVAEESRFEVDLRTLRSDQSRRDNYIQRNTLETERYPTAVFVPREGSGLPWPLPASGEFTFQLSGDLTIHGVTKPVTWEVTAWREDGRLVGSATVQITFQDFGMEQPRVAIVLSVEETIQLELDFTVSQE
jgi:polyisoprenoid-binding protein YceI